MWLLFAAALAAGPDLVVLDAGGAVYAHPGDAAPLFTATLQVPLRVVSDKPGWVEGSTVLNAAPACQRLADTNTAVELRVWVKERDLARIVTRRVEAVADDGSQIVVHAGYQVLDPADLSGVWTNGEAWAEVASAWQAVIPKDAWGLRASPDEVGGPPEGWRSVDLEGWDRALVVRGARRVLPDLEGLRRWGTPDVELALPGGPAAYAPAEGGRLHVAVDRRCLEVRGLAPGLQAPTEPGGLGGLIGGVIGRTGALVADGTALTWPDKTPAGAAREWLRFLDARADGERVCGVVPLLGSLMRVEYPVPLSGSLMRVEGPVPLSGSLMRVEGPVVCAPASAVQLAPSASTGTAGPIIMGALDRALIDGVVKEQLPKIRYCYQKALMKKPWLTGEMKVKFTIAAGGEVSAAEVKSSTLNDAEVERCVVDRFRTMMFPKPQGGGIVIVSYPFVFAPG